MCVLGVAFPVILAIPIVVRIAMARFYRRSAAVARSLLARAPTAAPDVLVAADVASLPTPVRRWVESSGAVGQPRARTVRVRQHGEMRTSPGGGFMRTGAEQYFTVDEPGFVWSADVTMMGVVPVLARDSYVEGRGRMFIQAAGLVTVADGTGEKFDQGTLLRFLGEIVWFPSAAVAPYIRWEPLDDHRATATMSYRGVTASAIFTFDDHDRVVRIAARRSYDGGPLEHWVIPVTEWGERGGITMPTKGSVTWKLAAGDFEYFRWEIDEVEVNVRALWGEGPL